MPMRLLDENTLEIVAEAICDTDGPNHRQYWQLPKFFRRAGWADVPEYDQEFERGRKWWTLDRLLERRADTDAITQVLCRLADPREYRDAPDDAQRVAGELNEVLALEGLQLVYRSGRPVIIERESALRSPAVPAPVDLKADVGDIVSDVVLAARLRARLDEARTCREYGAPLATVILLGGVLEGVLHDVVRQHMEQAFRCPASPRDRKTGKPLPTKEWKLSALIDVAHQCGWLQLDVQRFSHALREYRNMVHPLQEITMAHTPDADTVTLCWYAVVAALNDLAELHSSDPTT